MKNYYSQGSSQVKQLKKNLAQAQNYQEWKEVAHRLDQVTGLEAWKYDNTSNYYAYEFLEKRLNKLKQLMIRPNESALTEYLREGLNFDLANISHPMLYAHTYIGTKKVIEDYINTMCKAFLMVANQQYTKLDKEQKIAYFQSALQAYGQPALMFSGGATLGLFHSGVCKALFEQDLLPRVFSGSSAGSLMTGMVCTHTDAELMDLISGDGFYDYAFKFRSLMQILKDRTGIADITVLKKFLKENLGEYTFKEAFEKTGRHASVVVAPYEIGYQPRIMNELTSPDLLMWSASLASCAVPLLFPPVRLTTKLNDGTYAPYMQSTRWVDGSVRSDFPLEKMARLYNINYSIACQVNPHIVPFMQSDTERYREDLRSWPNRLVRRQAKNIALEVMDFSRGRMGRLPFVQRLLDHGYGIIDQRYYGNINIHGQYNLRHYFYMLQNPKPKLFKLLQSEGERATWPKISAIEIHSRIGKTLEHCLDHLLQPEVVAQSTQYKYHVG